MNTNRTVYGNLIVFILLWMLCVLAASSKHHYIATLALLGMLALVAYTYITERTRWINSQMPVNLPHEVEMFQKEGFFRHDTKRERRGYGKRIYPLNE